MQQFTGFPKVRARSLIGKMEFATEYSPEILVLLMGTNDLYEDVYGGNHRGTNLRHCV
ncbi:hypothetical protein DPMN_168840 [Dreissena polymorpha]|uniref:Uncharacterized protein n=1 Tax=Dreissena polymorpha TaxID=45954 RepID=A0A9D4F6B1_DREPO|nr:hypothetical protein DPMN_168840 [Dreissena polymorpha]